MIEANTGRIDRRRASSRRADILAHAQNLFLEHGLHQVTTRQLAKAVGISQPSLYAHFPTRNAIAIELCCRAFERLEAVLRKTEGAGVQRIRALGEAYIAFGLDHPAEYRVAFMLELPSDHDDEKAEILQAGLRAFSVLLEAYNDLLGDQTLASVAAQSAWAGLHGLVSLLLVRPQFPFETRSVLVAHHLDGVFERCETLARRED